MKNLKHECTGLFKKLNTKPVGDCYVNATQKQKGITLIALIITIIVMLILVAVTITVALDGGLFNKATKAAAETEKNSILEQIIQMAEYGNNGYIDVATTYAKVQAAFPGKVGALGANGVFTVQGKYGTYEYLLTNEIISLKNGETKGKEPIKVTINQIVNFAANMGFDMSTNYSCDIDPYGDGIFCSLPTGDTASFCSAFGCSDIKGFTCNDDNVQLVSDWGDTTDLQPSKQIIIRYYEAYSTWIFTGVMITDVSNGSVTLSDGTTCISDEDGWLPLTYSQFLAEFGDVEFTVIEE